MYSSQYNHLSVQACYITNVLILFLICFQTVSTRDHNGSDVSVYPFVNCYLSSRASYVIHNFLKEGICTLWVDIKLENNVNKDMDVLLEFFSNDIQMGYVTAVHIFVLLHAIKQIDHNESFKHPLLDHNSHDFQGFFPS